MCGYDRYKRKKNGGDDNNVDDENEPGEIKGKKKKANRRAPVRVAWYFCIIPRLRRWFATRKEAQLLHFFLNENNTAHPWCPTLTLA
jgi:hypothetical protein